MIYITQAKSDMFKPHGLTDTSIMETPYSEAQREWDKRLGDNLARAKSWRLLSFILCGIIFLLIAGLISVAKIPKEIPYIVEIDHKGQTKSIQGLTNYHYEPSELIIKSTLVQWIKKVRAIPADSVVMNQWQTEAYHYLLNNAQNKIKPMIMERLKLFGQNTISIDVISINAITENSYQVIWEETSFNKGIQEGKTKWTSIVTVKLIPPDTEDGIRINPLGIWIKDFSIEKLLKQDNT